MSILNYKYEKLHFKEIPPSLIKIEHEHQTNYIKRQNRRNYSYLIKIAEVRGNYIDE